MRRSLTVGRFFDGTTLRGTTRIDLENGVVTAVEPHDGDVDAPWGVPALVDVQMNGWDDVDVASADADGLARLDASLWREGTGTWLGTIVTAPLATMSSTLARLHALSQVPQVRGMVGVHVEGPFLGGAPGAHDRRHIVDVDTNFLDTLPSTVRLMTLAPESPGTAEAVRFLRDRNVIVSAGHTRCSEDEFAAFVRAGGAMVTHIFNGMSGVHHRDGGVALWALTEPEIRLGLIADGHHVRDDLARLVLESAPGRVCMVSDSVAWRSAWATARGASAAEGVVRLPDGTIAGSATSLLGCVRRAVLVGRSDPEKVFAAATAVPADLLGLESAGRVRVGSPCDLLLLDESLHVLEGVRGLASGGA